VSDVDVFERDVPAVIERPPLPDGWRWGEVAEVGAKQKNAIVDGPFGSNLKLTDYVADGTVPVLTTKNLAGKYDDLRFISEQKFQELKRSAVYPNDILMAKIGSCGKTGIYPVNMPPAIIPANLLKVTLNENFDKKFVFHYFNSRFFQRALQTIIRASAQPAFGVTSFRKLPFPIAPLSEQLLVVAEIEKQFSRLDEAVANLQRVKANLKRYKASVLKAAVEGRLVETEAILAHREGRTYETGEQLLQRILEERRAKWKGRGKFSEPDDPVATETFPIPDGWCISAIPQIATIASGNTPAGILDLVKPEGDVPWFKVGDMNHESNQHSMTHADAWLTHQQVENLGLRVFPPQTVIFPKRGGAIATNKKRLLSSFGACDLNVMGITPFDEVAPYFFLWFESIDLAKLSDGSNIPQINNKDIVPLIVPLPPCAEQARIVAEVDRHLSIIREVEAEVDANLKRAQALRQAMLAKAFGVEGREI
jgi:type I restriction enzyme, S subunit